MQLTDLAKNMIRSILIIAVIFTVGVAIYYRSLDFLPFMLGVVLGSAVSIYKVILLESAIDKALDMEKKRAGNYVSLQHLLRLLLSGVALVLGALVPWISLWGVVVGILAFQLALYTIKFTSKS